MKKNKKILILVLSIVVLAFLAAAFIFGRNKTFIAPTENGKNVENNTQSEELLDRQTEINNNSEEKNKLVTDDFSMELPIGWSKIANTVAGVTAMAANTNENISDAAAQTINFKSYLAISSDSLQGKTMREYVQSIKSELQGVVSGVVFANENDLMINGRSAHAIEAEMSQQGVNFKVLIVAIQGDGDDVWVISYNTTKNSWDTYKGDFSSSAKSFILK